MTVIYDDATAIGQTGLNQLLLKSAAKYREKLPQRGVSKFGEGASYFISETCMDNASDGFELADPKSKRMEEDLLLGLWGSEK